MPAPKTILAKLRPCGPFCAAAAIALALLAGFGSAAQAGVIVRIDAADLVTSVELSAAEQSNGGAPSSEGRLSLLAEHLLYGSGAEQSSGPQSGTSTSLSPQGSSAALPPIDDAARVGGQWRCLTELDEPRVLRDALDSVFHPPRGES